MKLFVFNDHFEYNLSLERAKQLFKQTVSNVAIAISSYCNRKCFYCPNIHSDISSNNYLIDDNLFNNVLMQLKDIDYSGIIQLHRYNEPLANKTNLLLRINHVRNILPNAKLWIYTNGDYLDTDYVKTLANLGVDYIVATLHFPRKHIAYDELIRELNDHLLARVKELGFEYQIIPSDLASKRLEITYKNLKLFYGVMDFAYIANRGGSIDLGNQYVRVEPCIAPFSDLQIEYDGSLLPCCNINIGVDKHKKYILGKLDAYSNIYTAWVNDTYVNWRRAMITFLEKSEPCANCTLGIIPDTPEHRNVCDILRQQYPLLR